MERVRAFGRLLQWLGPWSDASAAPSGIVRRELSCARDAGQAPMRLLVYARAHEKPCGALLVAPGLHPKGPDDPRLDRFLRILANAGFLVAAPALPDYLALRCDPNVARDFKRAFGALRALPECPIATPGVLSISFGSYPALRLLCDPERATQVSGGVIFGGYADPVHTLRYTLGERDADSPPTDPLSVPAVAINLVSELALDEAARQQLTAAWLEFARATWGYPELKQPEAHAPIAHQLAEALPSELRPMFLRGCGLAPDSREFLLAALDHNERLHNIDPRPHLANLRRPLHLMHGRDDDVIPCSELKTLFAACPPGAPVHCYLTGLYAHTGTSALGSLPKLLHEAATLLQMLRGLVQVATATA